MGWASYKWIEQPISRLCKAYAGRVVGVCFCFAVLFCAGATKIYLMHGVLHDVPELSISQTDARTWEPQDYNSAVFKQDRPFHKNGKENVLFVGDSFARDWYNVLSEAGADSTRNFSFHDKADAELRRRIADADVIFLATNNEPKAFFPFIPQMLRKRFFYIGGKHFFSSVGAVYNHCPGTSYFLQKGVISEDLRARNIKEREIFGHNFFNLMQTISDSAGRFALFTPEGKLISHDGLHLTRDGAKYYAKLIDTRQFFS